MFGGLYEGFAQLGKGFAMLGEGMANLFGPPPRPRRSVEQQLDDAWRQVGDDLRKAMYDIDEASREVLRHERPRRPH
jgi:hypothetical protein